jgi:hypothetical protein
VTRVEFQHLSSTVSAIQADSRLTLATLTQLVNHITKEKTVKAGRRSSGASHGVSDDRKGKAAWNGGRKQNVHCTENDKMEVDGEVEPEAKDEDEPPLYRHKYQAPLLTQRQVRTRPRFRLR